MNSIEKAATKNLERVLKEIGKSPSVSGFLSKYGPVRTRSAYANRLMYYFRWLKRKGVELSPDELIQDNLICVYKSDPTETLTKRKHSSWLLEYVNGYMKEEGYSQTYRVVTAAAVRKFYERNDSELFGDFEVSLEREKDFEKPLLPEDIRAVLKTLPLHVRLPYLMTWQSGIEFDKVLSLRWGDVQKGLDEGELPLRLSFTGRKRMKRPYYTYLGRESVESLRAWRGRWVEQLGREPYPTDLILLGKGNQPVDVSWLRNYLKRTVRQLSKEGLLQNRDLRSWHHHAFRKSFRTACSHAKVKSDFAEFWLGHDMGVKGVYDRADEVHEADFRAEYGKVEPFVSITPSAITIREEYESSSKQMLQLISDLQRKVARLEAQSGS